jgi:hypothetical protein
MAERKIEHDQILSNGLSAERLYQNRYSSSTRSGIAQRLVHQTVYKPDSRCENGILGLELYKGTADDSFQNQERVGESMMPRVSSNTDFGSRLFGSQVTSKVGSPISPSTSRTSAYLCRAF